MSGQTKHPSTHEVSLYSKSHGKHVTPTKKEANSECCLVIKLKTYGPKISGNQMITKLQPSGNHVVNTCYPSGNHMITKWQPHDNQVATI
jgi:hypothetical protein